MVPSLVRGGPCKRASALEEDNQMPELTLHDGNVVVNGGAYVVHPGERSYPKLYREARRQAFLRSRARRS